MNSTVSFIASVQDDIHAVEMLMRTQADDRHSDLSAALDLLLSAGGKRIRPALTMLAGRMLGADHQRLVYLAAAIEMLHTATLVHDDLIDGSLLRRGMPTLNARWSPGATVLTGDFLFSRAAYMAAQTDSVAVMKLFSQTLGIIVDGEINQLFDNRCRVDRDAYFRRIYAKTASLFETSARSAALIAAADETRVEALRAFGYHIGMAFQIVDDVLDFTAETARLGKPVGSDLRQGIITLPAILFIETHPDHPAASSLMEGKCLHTASEQEDLIESIRTSPAIGASLSEAARQVDLGLETLATLPATPDRCALEDLARYIVHRDL